MKRVKGEPTMSFTESTYENAVIQLFEGMGYTHIYAPDMGDRKSVV